MPECYRHCIKVTPGSRELRARMDRPPFQRKAMTRRVNGQIHVAKRLFPVLGRGGLNWLVQGSIRIPGGVGVGIRRFLKGRIRPGYAENIVRGSF